MRIRIEEAVRGAPTDRSIGAVLKGVAESLIARAKSAPQDRETALTILAADALVTLACEALAESDPAALREFR